jgi:multidrug efflux pump subunit AcrA (membrane-fusion protein)
MNRPLCALTLVLAACSRAPEKPPTETPAARAPVEVRLARVEAASLPRVVRATGTLEADDVVVVAADVPGKITSVSREPGDRIAPGEELARVDEADFKLELDQRRRALGEVLAKLALDALPTGDVDFDKLPSVERARLEAENAKAKLERARTLHDRPQPLVSAEEYADAKTTYEVAENAKRVALIDARADLATARTRQSEIEMSEKRLRDTLHVAPAGTRPGAAPVKQYLVAERRVAVGDRVTVGAPLYRLVDADPLRLVVRVPERRAAAVTVGMSAKAWTGAGPLELSGKVARIRPEVDPVTRAVDVEIGVDNADLAIQPGAFATVEIETGLDADVPMAPASAIRSFAGVNKAFVVADGKAAEKIVATGRRVGDRVEVVSGLRAGDEVVVDPPSDLVVGTPVRVGAQGK